MNITVPPSPDGWARRAREEEGTGREPGFHHHVKSFFSRFQKIKGQNAKSDRFPSSGWSGSFEERWRYRRRTITGPL